MSAPRILIVEDDVVLARGLVDNLRGEGFEVRHTARGNGAELLVREFDPQVIVLDLLLPDRPGLEILSSLRKSGDQRPVLVLTARGEVVDRVLGLELGADDYLGKPFAVQELRARIRALLRRPASAGSPHEVPSLTIGDVRFDFGSLSATREGGGEVELTVHDILVLRMLAEKRGAVVSRLDIVEEVCGLESDSTPRTVDNHVVALRRAIGEDPRRPRFIRTVRGIGYRLTIE